MVNERENSLKMNLTSIDGLPKVSFVSDNNSVSDEKFEISGNNITAYYDNSHKLIFILDYKITENKPNVLLVINPIADRKWDDILANDFNVNLENVRPKKDNKYQKLDIEYEGLSIYNNLINDFKSGSDLSKALSDLEIFREKSVRRIANERLIAANEIINKTNETVLKTNDTLAELQYVIKKLREKLVKQKKEVGKEPTKQSAAKILKTESQIEFANEKLKRAKKRLMNANKRLETAKEDAEISKRLLGYSSSVSEKNTAELKVSEKEANDMASEEVKPLFEKDPNILDDKIAFKPIDFNINKISDSETLSPAPVIQKNEEIIISNEKINEIKFNPVELKPVEKQEPIFFIPPQMNNIDDNKTVVSEEVSNTLQTLQQSENIVIQPIENNIAPNKNISIPDIPLVRPVSPVSGPENIIGNNEPGKHRPTALYYIMLIVLIVLSIFTLWLYQKNINTNVPNLETVNTTAVSADEQKEVINPELNNNNTTETPFINAADNVNPEVAPAEEMPQPQYEEPVVPSYEQLQPSVDDSNTYQNDIQQNGYSE